eukprot:1172593-Prorocentrum_minimum.AAC.1
MRAEAWAAAVERFAGGTARSLLDPHASFGPTPAAVLSPVSGEAAAASPGGGCLFTIVAHLDPAAGPAALPAVCGWALSQSLAARRAAPTTIGVANNRMPPFRVFGLVVTRVEAEAEEDSRVVSPQPPFIKTNKQTPVRPALCEPTDEPPFEKRALRPSEYPLQRLNQGPLRIRLESLNATFKANQSSQERSLCPFVASPLSE